MNTAYDSQALLWIEGVITPLLVSDFHSQNFKSYTHKQEALRNDFTKEQWKHVITIKELALAYRCVYISSRKINIRSKVYNMIHSDSRFPPALFRQFCQVTQK